MIRKRIAAMNILVAPDKFKGTLTAPEAARAIARGWRKVRPQDRLKLLPISDGGDGFGAILGKLIGARRMSCGTVDAAHRPCRAAWWWHQPSRTAIIESAGIIGLTNLPKGKFHPFELDTAGLAKVFLAAKGRGAKRIIVGVGGSATNDGGFGLARGLGWKFLGRRGANIERWMQLNQLVTVAQPKRKLSCEIVVAVDVQNRLLGATGATRIYGPQKGLGPADFPKAEACLRRLARVVGPTFANSPGAGAAGGLAFGLAAFLGAKFVSGFELFAARAGLDRKLEWADLVITGEGAMDRSTRMGKGVGQLVVRCERAGLPCFGLAGNATPEARNWKALQGLFVMTDCFGPVRPLLSAAVCLETMTVRVSGIYGQSTV